MMHSSNDCLNELSCDVKLYDPHSKFPERVMSDLNRKLEYMLNSQEFPLSVKQKDWSFFMVEGFDHHTKQLLEKQLQFKHNSTFSVIVVNSRIDKEILDYLLLPLNSIVTLPYLTAHCTNVLHAIATNGLFLESSIYRELSKKLSQQKSRSTPVKQFILNKNKVTINLTERDREVLQLLLDGHNNAAIAQELHFARSTVSTFISVLLKKMKAQDRTDAAVKAIRNGWVDSLR